MWTKAPRKEKPEKGDKAGSPWGLFTPTENDFVGGFTWGKL